MLLEKGFFHVASSHLISQGISLISLIILVRLLSKEDYGIYSFAFNLISFFLLINGLGTITGMLQYGSETTDSERRYSIFKYGLITGVKFDLILGIGILAFGLFYPIEMEAARLAFIMMLMYPLLIFMSLSLTTYFRTTLDNRNYSLLNILTACFVLASSILGAILAGYIGVILFRYIAYALIFVIAILILKGEYKNILNSKSLDPTFKTEFLKYSISVTIINALSQIPFLSGVLIIGIIIPDPLVVASYKVATLIPFGLMFIPNAVMVFIYPYFARHNTDMNWIRKKYSEITKYLIVLNGCLSVILIIFAPWIISIIFGEQYMDALIPFRILSIGYFVSATFRNPIWNILTMMRRVKFALILSISSGVACVGLDVFLISNFGSVGAAITNILIYIIISIASGFYFWHILHIDRKVKI